MERRMSEVLVTYGIIMAAFMQHYHVGANTVHIVGDSTGWTVPTNGAAFYQNWAANKKFMIGDTLTFNFTTNAHDVVQVPKESYDDCSDDNAIGGTIRTGPANIKIDKEGSLYFICTIGDHCDKGQKLSINVTASAAPSPSDACPPTGSSAPPPPPPASSSSAVFAGVSFSFFSILMGCFF